MKTEAEINRLCQLPGAEGVLWRLVKHWNPDGIGRWLKGEQLLATDVDLLAKATASIMATAVVGLARNCADPEAAIEGVRHHFRHELDVKWLEFKAAQRYARSFLPGARR